MDPLVTSSLIGVGGSLLGGMLGGSGDGKMKPGDYHDAAFHSIEGKIHAANKFGLHPLFALGANTPGPSQFIPGQSKWGSAAKDAAHAISNAIAQKKQNEVAEAQTDLLKAQTAEAKANADRINREINKDPTPQPPLRKFTGNQVHGMFDGPPPLYVPYYDTVTKKVVQLPNPEANIEMPETVGAYIASRPYHGKTGLFQSGRKHSKPKGKSRRGTRSYPK